MLTNIIVRFLKYVKKRLGNLGWNVVGKPIIVNTLLWLNQKPEIVVSCLRLFWHWYNICAARYLTRPVKINSLFDVSCIHLLVWEISGKLLFKLWKHELFATILFHWSFWLHSKIFPLTKATGFKNSSYFTIACVSINLMSLFWWHPRAVYIDNTVLFAHL